MMSFWKRRESPSRDWDRENTYPAVRCSICNGEKVFGFKSRHSDEFSEIALIRSKAELQKAASAYGISDIETIPEIY